MMIRPPAFRLSIIRETFLLFALFATLVPGATSAGECVDQPMASEVVDTVAISLNSRSALPGRTIDIQVTDAIFRTAVRENADQREWRAALPTRTLLAELMIRLDEPRYRITKALGTPMVFEEKVPGSDACEYVAFFSFELERLWQLRVESDPEDVTVVYRWSDTRGERTTNFDTGKTYLSVNETVEAVITIDEYGPSYFKVDASTLSADGRTFDQTDICETPGIFCPWLSGSRGGTDPVRALKSVLQQEKFPVKWITLKLSDGEPPVEEPGP